jgi:Tfp pilus assembly protein PilX
MRKIGKVTANHDERGVASIIVVTLLIVLLSLISVAFARLMTRTLANTSNRQQNSAAFYAAQSGINEITSLIKKRLIGGAGSTNACSDLTGQWAMHPDISGDGVTAYSCNYITSSPNDLAFQSIPPNRTQVVRLQTSGVADRLMVSWQSTDRTKINFPPTTTSLLDETTWNSNTNAYAPILRLTLYPVPAGDTLTGTPSTQAASKTFFLVPSPVSDTVFPYSTTDGSLIRTPCSTLNHYRTVAGFDGSYDYDCNFVVNGLSSVSVNGTTPSYYYAVLTPIYGQADVKIKANDATPKAITFINTQSVVDVSGKSGGGVKRLQARINISQGGSVDWMDNTVPDEALRSAMTLCKRLSVGATKVTTDADTQSCGLTLLP